MATFTKSTKDGAFTLDLTIQDGVEEFEGESVMELIEILTATARWLQTMIESEAPEELSKILKLSGES